MFCHMVMPVVSFTLLAEATSICESANATLWRNWPLRDTAQIKKLCSNVVMLSSLAGAGKQFWSGIENSLFRNSCRLRDVCIWMIEIGVGPHEVCCRMRAATALLMVVEG